MTTPAIFDVLIIYSESMATSAADKDVNTIVPFSPSGASESYNEVYGYFLSQCAVNGLSAAFSTSADIVAAGTVSSYWTFSQNTWSKYSEPGYSRQIFDKFSPSYPGIKTRRDLLFSKKIIKSFNDPRLFEIFFDKQKTYNTLRDAAIPTVSLTDNTPLSLTKGLAKLNKIMQLHSGKNDFSRRSIILKDRQGAGGRHIYKFLVADILAMTEVVENNPKIKFILQPFARFDQGFSYDGVKAATDIRLIFFHDQILQSYIRIAKAGDFRCNAHQGCTLHYLTRKQIPKSVTTQALLVAQSLPHDYSLYSLDFVLTNSGHAYLLEGNTGPGLNWDKSDKEDEKKAKELIRLIAKSLAERAQSHRISTIISNKTKIYLYA